MKLYVGTYHKYNCGSIYGKWIDLDDFSNKNEFLSACFEVHKDEDDPELMFQDVECEFGWERQLYSESFISPSYLDIKNALSRNKLSEEVFSAYVQYKSEDITEELVSQCAENYQGEYSDLKSFAESYCEETGMIDEVPPFFRDHIDYESIARDMECNSEFFESEGYVFRSW